MRLPSIERLLMMLSGVLFLPGIGWAQTATTGAIAGVVKDATGAVLPGVTVEAASPALIEKVRTVATDGEGQYKIVELRPGTYSVTFTLTGFSTVKRQGVELTAGFTAPVNAELRVGSLEETITVSGASPVVDTQNARTQNLLSREVLDALPTNKTMQGFAALTVGAVAGGTGAVHDVGGNKGDQYSTVIIHGSRQADGMMLFDGMTFNNNGGGSGAAKHWFINQVDVQEMVLETSGMSADTQSGGIQFNAIPKSGGNRFTANFTANGTSGSLQSNNLNDQLRARGLTATSTIKKIYDAGGGFGGPIRNDRLWFYTAHRWWGDQENTAGNYYNKTQGTPFYTPDPSRLGYTDYYNEDHTLRLTWQASQKHKFTFSHSVQKDCNCHLFVDNGNRSPEASVDYPYVPMWLSQATWTYPATNRLLFQAGISYLNDKLAGRAQPEVQPTDIAILELSKNYAYNAPGGLSGLGQGGIGGTDNLSQHNERFSVSYVTGSHAFKAGLFTLHGVLNLPNKYVNQAVSYTFNNGVPVSLTQWASPHAEENTLKLNLGAYVQDQWTIKRLTLNLGLRYDSVNAYTPAQTRPAGRFVPAFNFPEVDNIPNFKDLDPRFGAAYDLFGNGKTAVKVSLGRYVDPIGGNYPETRNLANTIVTSANRTWNDSNGNYVPDCDLSNFTSNGECGAIDNTKFGTVNIATHDAADVLGGFGNRPYSWLGSASVQHELRPGMAFNVAYYRRWRGNFPVTANIAVTPADFDSYCVTAPVDPRIPGGGGNQICGLGDVNPAKFGQVNLLRTLASHYGNQSEIYNGLDLTMNARFGRGGLLSGGVNVGRTATHCVRTDVPIQYCDNVPPFQPQFKAAGSYPLPWWDLQASAIYQGLAGVPIGNAFYSTTGGQTPLDYAFTNAQIAPSLGRNLAACGTRVPCTATAIVQIVEPNKYFDERLNQVDFRLTKNVRWGRGRVLGTFDVYNAFNGSTPTAIITRYGPSFLKPVSVMGGRVFKFGGQLDF